MFDATQISFNLDIIHYDLLSPLAKTNSYILFLFF